MKPAISSPLSSRSRRRQHATALHSAVARRLRQRRARAASPRMKPTDDPRWSSMRASICSTPPRGISPASFPRGVPRRPRPTTVYGCLCMNIDVIREEAPLPGLKAGDQFVMHPVGAYNITQAMQFITYRPAVVMIGRTASARHSPPRESRLRPGTGGSAGASCIPRSKLIRKTDQPAHVLNRRQNNRPRPKGRSHV